MQIPRHIFKKYDIRGLVNEEVTPELARAIGRGFATFLLRESGTETLTLVVGRDMRETSPEYALAVIEGMRSTGVNVKDVGLVSTPAFYFSVGHLQADGGVMVSASHNPAAYNGFKLVRARARPVSDESGIEQVADLIEAEDFVQGEKGDVETVEGMEAAFVQMSIDFAGWVPKKKWKMVVDTANGMGAAYLKQFFTHVDAEVVPMYWEFDGTFPNHEADPLKLENSEALRERMKAEQADFGIATDGDGDRIFFFDDKGDMIDPAIVRGMIAQRVLKNHPGAPIGYDIRPGRITQDMIEEAGGKPFVTRVGHSLIKEKMIEMESPFSGESSGHFFYQYETGNYEGPVTVLVQMLQTLEEAGKTASEYVTPLMRYVHSGEINFAVADKQAAIDRVRDAFADGELNDLDGVTITYDDFWFNVRASNTESKLRLNLEALDQATMEAKRDQVAAMIQG